MRNCLGPIEDRAGVLVSKDLVSRNLAETPGPDEWWLAVDEAALEALESPKTTGRVVVTIEGKTYNGKIEVHEHAH